MAKYQNDLMLDAALDWVSTNAEKLHVCSSQPAAYANVAAASLAEVAVAGGDFTKANGDTSGRKLTVAAKTTGNAGASGSGTHVVLVDDTNSRLVYITTCPTKTVNSGDPVDVAAWDIELADAS